MHKNTQTIQNPCGGYIIVLCETPLLHEKHF